MKTIIAPKAKRMSQDGFKPFDFQKLESIEQGVSKKESKEPFFKGKCSEGKTRILMAGELVAVNEFIIEKYLPVIKSANPNVKKEETLRAKLSEQYGHLAPLVTPEGLIGIEGEEVLYNNPTIARVPVEEGSEFCTLHVE